jgi:hypothetical protein
MAENGAARSGPCSSHNEMTRSAMTMQELTNFMSMPVRIVPGIVRIGKTVVSDDQSG